jgi:hypothetical protein
MRVDAFAPPTHIRTTRSGPPFPKVPFESSIAHSTCESRLLRVPNEMACGRGIGIEPMTLPLILSITRVSFIHCSVLNAVSQRESIVWGQSVQGSMRHSADAYIGSICCFAQTLPDKAAHHHITPHHTLYITHHHTTPYFTTPQRPYHTTLHLHLHVHTSTSMCARTRTWCATKR